jgi:hypothetical protein
MIQTANVSVVPGILNYVPKGYTVSNLDPNFNSTSNNEIYDPNFLPGFESGLTNTTISWNSGTGYADLGYSVGPWTHQESPGIPHFAVGPQCCNFQEVPHTQQFRRIDWGDYYYVKAGLGSPGVNVENYTTNFSAPAYVGLRTDWDWRVQFSLNWNPPVLMDPANEWGAIGISVTQYVPNAPGNLVSTLINFWMDSNGTRYIPLSTDGTQRRVGPNLVTYHPAQMALNGNTTITLDISPYLQDTLSALGLQNDQNLPPVISYVYLNVEGYNLAWNTTLWSFNLMSQRSPLSSSNPVLFAIIAFVVVLSAITVYWGLRRRLPSSQGQS